MILWWSVNIISLLMIGLLLILLSMFWPPDSPWSPWWRTNKKIARLACKLAGISKKDIIYELGSGDGAFLMVAAKEFGARGVGIEIDPLRFIISKLIVYVCKIQNEVKIVRKNFYDVNISGASVVFVYLVPRVLGKLRQKFLKELKPETRVISYRYKINLPLTFYDKKNDLYFYKIT